MRDKSAALILAPHILDHIDKLGAPGMVQWDALGLASQLLGSEISKGGYAKVK